MNNSFAVLMSVYAKEKPEFLEESLATLARSSILPGEVILVEDGPLTKSLHAVIARARTQLNISSVKLKYNIGLPGALNAGLEKSKYELIARFDTDDICAPDRFEKQLNFLIKNPEVAAVGSAIQEFDSITGEKLGYRAPPCDHASLLYFSRLSSPLNHPSVMFRRSAVMSVGGYPVEMRKAYEDYALWLNLILAGYKLANLPQVLVHMRAGAAQVSRRSGLIYAQQEIFFAIHFYRKGFFNAFQLSRFLLLRTPLRFFPKNLISVIYRVFARS